MGWNLTAKVTVILFKFKWRKKLDWQDRGELTNRFCWRYPQLVKLDMKQSYRLFGIRVKYAKRWRVFTYISHFLVSISSILYLKYIQVLGELCIMGKFKILYVTSGTNQFYLLNKSIWKSLRNWQKSPHCSFSKIEICQNHNKSFHYSWHTYMLNNKIYTATF